MALSKLTSPLCIIACSASTFVHVQQRSRLTERLDRRVEIDGDYFGAERAIAPSTVGWGGRSTEGTDDTRHRFPHHYTNIRAPTTRFRLAQSIP